MMMMNMGLIPDLVDEISLQIIARVPRIYYMEMRLVSRSWKAAIMSTELFSLRKKLGTTEEWVYMFADMRDSKHHFPFILLPSRIWYCLDPLSSKWQRLPLMNGDDDVETRIPRVHGCASVSFDGCLYVLGGCVEDRYFRSAWRYDPIQYRWSELSPMRIGRAYFNAGVLNDKIYVVGGGVSVIDEVQYVEVLDPLTGVWSDIPGWQPCDEAIQRTVTHGADIATYNGKLFVRRRRIWDDRPSEIEVVVYDPETNSWSTQMPPAAMFTDWPSPWPSSWPARAVMNNGRLYALHRDPTTFLDVRSMKVYDEQCDVWRVVSSSIPMNTSSGDYVLLASFLGKLHVIRMDRRDKNITVMQYSSKDLESETDDDDSVWKVIATRRDVLEFVNAAHVIDI